jgi:hypothetical protein
MASVLDHFRTHERTHKVTLGFGTVKGAITDSNSVMQAICVAQI